MLIYGTDSAETLNGTAGGDSVYGGGGNDFINAGDGNDFINGGEGADAIEGGLGSDSILGGAGADLIRAGDGDDWVNYVGETGDDTVYGGSGNDFVSLPGSIGAKTLFGESGDDTLNGGVDNDSIDGGPGSDSINGGEGGDSLSGGPDNDVIAGAAGNDTLDAGDGNDFISGGNGADSISGGVGVDSIVGGAGDDFIDAGDGDDWLSYADETGFDTVYAGNGDDLANFNGSSGAKRVFGGAGNDRLTGGVDNDAIDGGDGHDFINGGVGADTIEGGLGSDSILGGAGADLIRAGDGDDWVNYVGETGDDTVYGGSGNDFVSLAGSTGAKTLFGESGDDTLNGGVDNDSIDGGDGNDSLSGADGNDTLDGGEGGDSLNGGGGDDTYVIDSRLDRIVDADGLDSATVSVDWAKIPSAIENVTYVNGARSLPYWISALLYDGASGSFYKSLLGNSNDVYFAFPAAVPAYDTATEHADGYVAFNDAQKANTRAALAYLESVVDLDFVESTDPARPNTIAFALNRQIGSGGYSLQPSESLSGSDVFLNDADYNASLSPGTFGAQVVMHEVGHALGLKHPFDEPDSDGGTATPPYLEGDEDSTRWTKMSYTDPSEDYGLSLSPLDIAALQYLYGPSPSSRSGDDVYVVEADSANFVWDGAGVDRIDAGGAPQAITLSLEPGVWSHFGASPAATITAPGQITINFGTVIENARGSAFADRISGNDADNSLQGGDGADSLEGRDGGDRLHGDGGDDLIEGGDGADTLSGGSGNDTLRGGAGADTAQFSGARKDYNIGYDPADQRITVTSLTDGVDALFGVESIAFSDMTVAAFEAASSAQTLFSPLPRVRIKTSLGDLVVELESDRAPVTVTNFLKYVNADFYDNTEFHRIIASFMAQGGGYDYLGGQYVYKNPLYPAIALEKTSATGLSNTAGTLAMARTSVANSATSQFFINFADNLFLDATKQSDGNGYAVFGRVVDGAATLAALKQVKVAANSAGEESQPTSAITLLDVGNEPPAYTALPTGTVTLSGAGRQGETLSASNTLADADGIPATGQPGAISYYWKADGVIIPGATASTLNLTQAMVGMAISVAASYTDLKGTSGSVTSAAVTVSNINDWPSGQVLISGTPSPGVTLTASHTLSDLDGIPSAGQPGAVSWQWRVGGLAVAGATESSFTVRASDVGKPITVSASYTDLTGNFESVLSAAAGAATSTTSPALPRAWLRTSYGDLLIELEAQKAPVTVANFVSYLTSGFYNDTAFHRVIDGFMVQGGGYTYNSTTGQYVAKASTFPAITLEKTSATGLSNLLGTIAMARTSEPNSATSEFFINDVDNLFLDANRSQDGNGYAVFGRLVDGYRVLDLLSQVAVTANDWGEKSRPTSALKIWEGFYDSKPPAGEVRITGLPMQGQTLKAEHTLVDPDGLDSAGVLAWIWRLDGVPVTGLSGSTYLLTSSAVGRSVSVEAVYRDALGNYGYVASAASSMVAVLDSVSPTIVVSGGVDRLLPGQTTTVTFTLSEPSSDFDLADIGVSGGGLSNFTGSGTTYSATFTAAADGSSQAVISVASGKFSDLSGNRNIDGSDANNSVMLSIVQSEPSPSAVQGAVYHWKSHALLSGVQVSAVPQVLGVPDQSLFAPRNLTWTASGELRLEIWADFPQPVENLSLQVDFLGAGGGSFVADSATTQGWTLLDQGSVSDSRYAFVLEGFGLGHGLTGSVRLGQLTVDVLSNSTVSQGIEFMFGEAGPAMLAPYGVSFGMVGDATEADGRYELSLSVTGEYRLEASKALATADTGTYISSADALAALKMAVGINPNADPDGGGPLSAPPVSPYQYLSAEVTGDGKVSGADALAILKMAVKRSDARSPEWLFAPEQQDFWNESAAGGQGAFTTTRTSVKDASGTDDGVLPIDIDWQGVSKDVNLVAMVKGDVNGDWSAPSGSQFLPDSYFSTLVAANPLLMNTAQFGVI